MVAATPDCRIDHVREKTCALRRRPGVHFLGGAATVACCGGGSAAAPSHEVTVGVSTTKLGRVLVDSQGRTLCRLKADSGPTSTCFDGCAAAWPPLRAAGTLGVGRRRVCVAGGHCRTIRRRTGGHLQRPPAG